jgi:hypothetical protein
MKICVLQAAVGALLGGLLLSGCVTEVPRQDNRPLETDSFDVSWEESVNALLELNYTIQSVSKEAGVITTNLRVHDHTARVSRVPSPASHIMPSAKGPTPAGTNVFPEGDHEWRLTVRILPRDSGATVHALVQNFRAYWENQMQEVESGGTIEDQFYQAFRQRLKVRPLSRSDNDNVSRPMGNPDGTKTIDTPEARPGAAPASGGSPKKFCGECGAKFEGAVKFCGGCGTKRG